MGIDLNFFGILYTYAIHYITHGYVHLLDDL